MNTTTSKLTFSLAIGAIVAIVFVALATIGGELYHPFKDWLANTFSHHWVGKGVISVLLFTAVSAVGYVGVPLRDNMSTAASLRSLMSVTIFSFLAILLFYTLHYTGVI